MKQELIEAFQEAIRSHCAAVTKDGYGGTTDCDTFKICKAYGTILRLQYSLSDADIKSLIKVSNN